MSSQPFDYMAFYREVLAEAAFTLVYRDRAGNMVVGEVVTKREQLKPRLRQLRKLGVQLVCVTSLFNDAPKETP